MGNSDKKPICHPDKTLKARGLCSVCYEKWWEAQHPEYVEKSKEYRKNWRQQNKEKEASYRAKRKQKDAEDPNFTTKMRDKTLMTWYGMTQADYAQMLANQQGVCAICLRPPLDGVHFHVDHDHETGLVRGLLCSRCNWYLGVIDNDISVIDRIIQYKNQTEGKFKCQKKRQSRKKD